MNQAMTLRPILVNAIKQSAVSPVYVAASGGVDGSSLVVSALDAGVETVVVSFTLDDRESMDFCAARQLAVHFGVPFIPVYLPTDADFIIKSVVDNIRRFGLKGKAAIECMYPYMYMIDAIASEQKATLVMGHGADSHFCLSKKGMIHYRHSLDTLRLFRKNYFSGGGGFDQRAVLYKATEENNLVYIDPYWHQEVIDLFGESTWDELNKPRQKEPIRKAFPELDPLRLKQHTNLQLGDSGIAETVGEVMRLHFTPNARSAVSAYNKVRLLIERNEVI